MSAPALVTAELQKFQDAKHRVARAKFVCETATGDGHDEIERLATLSPFDYERERKKVAKELGFRTAQLDQLVNAKRPKAANVSLQGRGLLFAEIEPWPQAVNGADVLNAVAETFSRYIVLPDGAANLLALWCAHAHLFEAFDCSPRLNVSSPDKQCGKTVLLMVITLFVLRPVASENLTVAVLFRVIEGHKPTLLVDECDAWIRDNEELRGMLNAGHRRSGQALRCEGENNEIRTFNVFAPVVLAGIGSLPTTLHDRSIVIRLARAKPSEVRERFDSRRTEREQQLCRKLARFCVDSRAAIEACDPELPAGAFNRVADNWRPLFAIAQVAGGDWPQRAADAYAKLTRTEDEDTQGIGLMLLDDIRKVFLETKAERIFSKTLVECLIAMTDRPWLEARKDKPITENWLARKLRLFGVRSKNVRIGEPQAKGYDVKDFDDVFKRYLPDPDTSNRPSVPDQQTSRSYDETNRPIENFGTVSKRPTQEPWDGSESLERGMNTGLGRWDASNGKKQLSNDLIIPADIQNTVEAIGECIDRQRV